MLFAVENILQPGMQDVIYVLPNMIPLFCKSFVCLLL